MKRSSKPPRYSRHSSGQARCRVNGRVVYLGEYVQGLASQTASTLDGNKVISTDANRAEARSTSMVSVSTVPLRDGEPLSAVTVSMGNLSCIAEDNR